MKEMTIGSAPFLATRVAVDGLGKRKGYNLARYIKHFLEGLLKRGTHAQRRARRADVVVLDDNAPCLLFNVTYAAREELGITSTNYPLNCPDLNAIENLQ